MRKKMNAEVLLIAFILDGMAILLVVALLTGKIHFYVHPRLDVWLWLAVPALILISLSFLPKLFKPRRNLDLAVYWIILIPLLTAAFLPAVSQTNNQVQFSGTSTSATANSIDTSSVSVSDTISSVSTEPTSSINAPSSLTPTPAVAVANTTEPAITISDNMVIEDEQFAEWLLSVNDNMNAYEGVTVTYKGQVIRDDSFLDNEFVPARMAMWCCAADTMPYGFICRYDGAEEFADDAWVLVTGIIHIEDFDGETMPIVYATSVETTDAPEEIYIFFY